MSDSPISLSSLMTPSKTVTLDFPGYADMSVDLCYLAREELLKLRKRCITTKFNRKSRQPEEELDDGVPFEEKFDSLKERLVAQFQIGSKLEKEIFERLSGVGNE